MIEINPVPVCIAGVWYYEKINCYLCEKYISVREYKKRYSSYCNNQNSAKSIIVYDEKEKTKIKYLSYKSAGEKTGVNTKTIWWAIHHKKGDLVKGRYKFKGEDKGESRNKEWEYSNKNFND